ncbi:MAG: hypothetical protein R3E72_01135 [Steroidobacteraceae bacterium]
MTVRNLISLPWLKLVETGYRTIPFPTVELQVPRLALAANWTLDELFGYVSS